jgi:hydroxymethylpyrimidine/phosphomethylpyrimidine kinase
VFAPQIDVNASLDDNSGDGREGGPVIVVAGGIDPAGAAGLLRDVATVRARGARPWAVGTAWTEQAEGVHRVEPREPAAVGAALAHALRTARPAAVKIGMAVGPATADALLRALDGYAGAVVVDPVLATSRGGSLWDGDVAGLWPLVRRATLVTPNALEGASLTDGEGVHSVMDAEAVGLKMIERGARAVLMKGGHIDEHATSVTDVLVNAGRVDHLSRARIQGPSPRGTGCALATAIAVELGRGHALLDATSVATRWLSAAIAARRVHLGELVLGEGSGSGSSPES